MDKKDLAKAILLAVEIRENSFTENLIDKQIKDKMPVRLEMFYGKSYIEAVDDAVELLGLSTDWVQVIALLIRHTQSQIMSWANFQLEEDF